MIKVLIGHRGVGKTSLLQRWKTYQPQIEFFDLDQEIEKFTGLTVFDFFSQKGESEFRRIEAQVFHTLIQDLDSHRIISCGAGLDLTQIPKSVFVIWIRRDSDFQGRILLDRPQVNVDLSQREMAYARRADYVYTMPEGLVTPDNEEKFILLHSIQIQACITLYPSSKLGNVDVTYEWRDDLVTEDEFLNLDLKSQDILYSVRTDQDIPLRVVQNQYPVDWDLKRAVPTSKQIHYLSTHEDQILRALDALKPYEKSQYHLKLCPLVENWKELKEGFDWQQLDPLRRNFLPRSTNGRWDWFRLFMKSRQSLHFIRMGQGSNLDQPTLWQWLSVSNPSFQKFAAVLGSPIQHSYSPTFHKKFFSEFQIPFFAIRIDEAEWPVAIPILQEWGLAFAAVTSPLKKQAGHLVQKLALNTIAFDIKNKLWKSINTDPEGLQVLFQSINQESVVVWGGGGLLDLLKVELPQAQFYSARSGAPREASSACKSPDVLIWAAGQVDTQAIPRDWAPKKIIDLSYIENSVARILAQKYQCQYISGLEMFKAQAHAQQKFWTDFLSRD